MNKRVLAVTIATTAICLAVVRWIPATGHEAKQLLPHRQAYVLVDQQGNRISSLFANRSPSTAYIAFFDRYSGNLGKVSHTGACAPKADLQPISWWGRVKRSISTWSVSAQTCTNCAFYINAPCPDPECYSTYCYNFGPGCFETVSSCNCDIATDCDCGFGG
jgi:hypothetical protein